MPDQPAAERTEYPTARRLSKVRLKGQVPQSQELISAAILSVLVLMLTLLAPNLLQWFMVKTVQCLSAQGDVFRDSNTFVDFARAKIIDSMLIISPIIAALAIASVVACVVVAGFNYAPQALQPKWSALNPASGLQNLFNGRSLVQLVTAVAKLCFITLILWLYLRNRLNSFAGLRWAWSGQLITALAQLVLGLCIRACIALAVIAIADTFYQKWKYIEDLKMTRQEVKNELKDYEGSPQVKARVRRIQVQMSVRRFLAEVPKASVILVNPTHVAVAIRYEPKDMDAPVLVAKGADNLAQRITIIGRAYGVPVVRRPELARTIYSTVQPGSPIPEYLYIAVAEVLAMIYRIRQRKKKQ